MKKALLLGAGGPLGALEAGALIALDEKGVKFDVISGACIGSIIALAYASPNNMSGREALNKWIENTPISDFIYGFLPVDYKIFLKDLGIFNPFVDNFLSKSISFYLSFFPKENKDEIQKFIIDFITLSLVSLLPNFTTPYSLGVSRIAEDAFKTIIDFEKLKNLKSPKVYINALNITRKEVQTFSNSQITPEILAAGSSLFFLVSPREINGEWFAEGSYIDSINFKGVLKNHKDLDVIVVMNILDRRALIRKPKDLFDAYILSVILPFVTIANDDIKLFKLKYQKEYNVKLLELNFDLGKYDDCLDWSSSNFNKLKDIGYKSGIEFYNKYKSLLEG